jgi:hypothetical protein
MTTPKTGRLVGGPDDGRRVAFHGHVFETCIKQRPGDPPHRWLRALYEWEMATATTVVGRFVGLFRPSGRKVSARQESRILSEVAKYRGNRP